MRTNQPITQHEIVLGDARLIVLKTGLQGRLMYVNRDFMNIAGGLIGVTQTAYGQWSGSVNDRRRRGMGAQP